jgi:hypothetical protein
MMKRRGQPFEARSFLEVGAPAGIKGIRIRLDFQMTPDPDVGGRSQPMPDCSSFRGAFAIIDCKGPRPSPDVMPILVGNPSVRLIAVPSPRPLPQATPDQMIDLAKRALCRDVPMISNPAQDDRVELPYQTSEVKWRLKVKLGEA